MQFGNLHQMADPPSSAISYDNPPSRIASDMCPAQSARRLSNVSPIRTNDSVSRACPIGHALDISFENWTSSLRIYILCRFSSFMSRRVALNCADGGVLTLCPPRRFSISCPLLEWCVSRMRATGRLSAVRRSQGRKVSSRCRGLAVCPGFVFVVVGVVA
jgi:hypothetical protein